MTRQYVASGIEPAHAAKTISTEAWVLYAGEPDHARAPQTAQLRKESFGFPDITEEEVLVEPLYGCWEANMTHALERQPVDICHQRGEERVVIGNAGVVRILKAGAAVTTAQAGDVCVLFGTSIADAHGYPIKVVAYDTPGTMGMLAKQAKLHQSNVIPIPQPSPFSLPQWAAFSVRYITAWASWHVSYKCWQSQMEEVDPADTYVAAWGGGVSLAECELAKHVGCQAIMLASSDARLQVGRESGITMIDRRAFPDLNYDEARYQSDRAYRQSYEQAEKAFVQTMREQTNGTGVSIFIDNIGTPVYRATLKALARQGVITTCGWKHGMKLTNLRAIECINRHIHVHTYYARYAEGVDAVAFAHKTGWMAPPIHDVYDWDDMPQLANDYAHGRLETYFPIFTVNPL